MQFDSLLFLHVFLNYKEIYFFTHKSNFEQASLRVSVFGHWAVHFVLIMVFIVK